MEKSTDWAQKKPMRTVSQQNYEIHTTAPFVDRENRIVFCVTLKGRKTILLYDKKEDSISIVAQKIVSKMPTNHIYCYHPHTHSIYIFTTSHGAATALIYNMLTDKWCINRGKKGTEVCGDSVCVCVGNTIYIFGRHTNTILIYEVTKGLFLNSMELTVKLRGYENSIYLPASNTIFITAINGVYELSATVCEVSIKNKYTLPIAGEQFGCVGIEQCILIFGGQLSDKIYMLNVATAKWSQSVIITPGRCHYHAVLLDDDVHLFSKFDGSHYAINMNVLLNAKWTEITQKKHEFNKDIRLDNNDTIEQNEAQSDSNDIEYNTDETVRKWLKQEVKLPQYIDNFIDEGYDDMATIIESINEE
eukprot:194227_1